MKKKNILKESISQKSLPISKSFASFKENKASYLNLLLLVRFGSIGWISEVFKSKCDVSFKVL